jgi:hypothetical protein
MFEGLTRRAGFGIAILTSSCPDHLRITKQVAKIDCLFNVPSTAGMLVGKLYHYMLEPNYFGELDLPH